MNAEHNQSSGNRAPWPVITTDNFEDNSAPGEKIKVRCIDPRGVFYDYVRRREGDVFELRPQYVTNIDAETGKPVMKDGKVEKRLVTAKQQFSTRTMELVEDATPVNVTSAQEALNKEQPRGRR